MTDARLSGEAHAVSRSLGHVGLWLVGVAVLSTIPLASNRPAWWLLWTAVIAVTAAYLQILLWRHAPRRAPRVMGLRVLFLIAALLPVYGLVQCLPIGALLPASLARPNGVLVSGSGAISILPSATLAACLRIFGYLVFLALVVEVAGREARARRMAMLLFTGLVGQAIWALVALNLLGDLSLWGDKGEYAGVATGTYVNRNAFATLMGFGMILGIALVAQEVQGPQRDAVRPWAGLQRLGTRGTLILLGTALLGIALVETQSRLGLAASLVGAAVTVILVSGRRAATAAVIGLLLAAAAALALRGDGLLDRMLDLGGASGNRLTLYRQILPMIADRPLTGFGLDTFWPAFEKYRAAPLLEPVYFERAHNSYLTLWVEAGVIFGSVLPIALAWCGVLLFRRVAFDRSGPSALAAGALGMLVLGALHSLGDFSLEIPANALTFLLILGLGLARLRARHEDGGAPEKAGP